MKTFRIFSLSLLFFAILFVGILAVNSKAKAVDVDFSVDSITVSPASPIFNQECQITVKVKNNGSGDIESPLGLGNYNPEFPNFEITGEDPIGLPSSENVFSPGEYVTYTFTGYFTRLKEKTLKFSIDTNGAVQESNEKNNTLSKKVTIQGRDLYAEEIVVSPKNPGLDQKCLIIVKIKNNGTYPLISSNGLTTYNYDFEDFEQTKLDYTIPSHGNIIDPDEYVEFVYEGSFSSIGEKSLSFEIDTEDDLEEPDLDNNSVTKTVTVPTMDNIDINVDSIKLSVEKPLVNKDVQIIVSIKNLGAISLNSYAGLLNEDMMVDFGGFVTNSFAHDDYPTAATPLDQGDIFEYVYNGKFDQPGAQTLTFQIDKNNRLTETDETNNILAIDTHIYINQDEIDAFSFLSKEYHFISSSSVKFIFTTDKETTGKVFYKKGEYSAVLELEDEKGDSKTHQITISKLLPNTNYYYKIAATRNTLTNDSGYQEFKTPIDDELLINSGPLVTYKGANGVSVAWTTNLLSNGILYYKLTSAGEYEETSGEGSIINHNIELFDLGSGQYEYYVKSVSSPGTIAQSGVGNFNISAPEEQTAPDTSLEVPVGDTESTDTGQASLNTGQDITNSTLYDRLKGTIILTVESSGEAYYIHPLVQKRYYLGRPNDAFTVMREQGVGITNQNLKKIPVALSNLSGPDMDQDGLPDIFEDALGTDKTKKDSDNDGHDDKIEMEKDYNPVGEGVMTYDNDFAGSQIGKIFLQVEGNGEAWYVNPSDKKRYFLGRPTDAFNVMRFLGLGISNENFNSL